VNSGTVNRVLLQAFLVVMFFVYYQTRGVPGTLHAWLLLLGLTTTAIGWMLGSTRFSASLPIDYAVLAVFCMLLLVSLAVNITTASFDQVKAYLLAVGCYVFVREHAWRLAPHFMLRVMKCFLVINGLLVMLQFLTGEFYPARYFAAGDPLLLFPSGVSDGPTKNGMLISFALCYLVGHLVWGRGRASLSELAIFALGVLSLVLAISRAGLVSFIGTVLLIAVYGTIKRRRVSVNRRNSAALAAILMAPVVVAVVGAVTLEALTDMRDPGADRYAADVLMFKLTATQDDSFSDRYVNVREVIRMMEQSPLHVAAVGFGSGSFETLHGQNLHNSYFEVLFETGLYGFLALLFLTVHVTRRALARPDAYRILPTLCALSSSAMFMAFHDVLRGRTFWVPLAMVAAFAYTRRPAPSPLPATRDRSAAAGPAPAFRTG
jgi:O-antigen ligase